MATNSLNLIYKRAGGFYSLLGRHPFLISFGLIFLLVPLCFGAQSNITDSAKMIWCLAGLAIPIAALFMFFSAGMIGKKAFFICTAVLVVPWMVLSNAFIHSDRASLWIFGCMAGGAFLYWYLTLGDKERSDRHNAFCIMLMSFSIKFCYVLYSSCYTRQNDVRSFDGDAGHAGYIEYLIRNKHLPDFLPTSKWQFYHPPLHHTISACWIDFCENILGASRNHARESLQMLMLFYSVAAVIIVYKLLRYFDFSGRALLLPLALFAFHPAYILSSGAINNDQLAALMTVLTMLFTVRWFRQPDTRHIIPIALSIGFGMMAKLNVGTIAPAVAALFLWQLVVHIREVKTFIRQFFVFGVICVPLGLWWQIKNRIQWGMPFDYVPNVGGNQYIEMGIFERLFDFSPKQFSPVFENWINDGREFTEYNPNIAILKNSLFGENIKEQNFPGQNTVIPTVLFWLAAVLALIGVFALFFFLFRRDTRLSSPFKLFFAVYWAFTMYYFYVFCYTYSATCTMNFRYLTPLLAVSAVEYALLFDHLDKDGGSAARKTVSKVLAGAVIAFCVLSVVTYLLVGYAEVK